MKKILFINLLFFFLISSCSIILYSFVDLDEAQETKKDNKVTVYHIVNSSNNTVYRRRNYIYNPSETMVYKWELSENRINNKQEELSDSIIMCCESRSVVPCFDSNGFFDVPGYAYASLNSDICTVEDFVNIEVSQIYKKIYIKFPPDNLPLEIYSSSKYLTDNSTVLSDSRTQYLKTIKTKISENNVFDYDELINSYDRIAPIGYYSDEDLYIWARMPSGQFIRLMELDSNLL